MGQLGFFDVDKRLTALSAKGDPLEVIDRLVPWESFRADIEMVVLTPDEARKSNAGRKPFDAILMLRMLVLQSLYNLADEQVEYQVRDRLSFTRFLRLGIEDGIPDGTTLWLFREKLAKAGLIEKLFDRFDHHLGAHGYIARGGQIVDATIVAVPRQRNTRAECDAVKRGETPAAWKKKPAKNRQKDKDARWTQKHGKSFYGYKNHVNADAKHKLIRRYAVSDAAVHASQELDGLLNKVIHRTTCSPTVPIARLRPKRSSRRGASGAAFTCAHRAVIRSQRRKRTPTERRAGFALVSSTCSALSRPRRVAAWYEQSASSEREPRSDCRTSSTTSVAS